MRSRSGHGLGRFAVVALSAIVVSACAAAPRDEAVERASQPLSSGVVIRAFYGGGGNTGATWSNDFVELFNRGASAVTMDGWSLQYASATGTFSGLVAITTTTLQPGQHYLIQLASGSSGGTSLPATADQTGTFDMASAKGKLALVASTTKLACSGTACASDSSVVDFVGWGIADGYEGSAAAPGHDVTSADERAGNGCTETDDNASDFAVSTSPSFFNSSSGSTPCGTAPVDSGVPDSTPADTDVATDTGASVDSGKADSGKADTGKADGGYNVDLSPAGTCAHRAGPSTRGGVGAFALLGGLALSALRARRRGRG